MPDAMARRQGPEEPNGKVAIVTGGTRGIGAAIVRRLLADGWDVTACGRQHRETPPSPNGREPFFFACDVREPEQVQALVDSVTARHGRLDAVVNNAGGSPQADAATASARFADAIVALNLMAPLHMARAAYPHLKRSNGAIINIASVSAVRPSPGTAVYGAAKAGLLSLTKSLAQEWGPHIRVNAVIVGLIETEDAVMTYGSDEARQRIAASLPLARMGRGEDVAAAVAFLASPAAAYVSGAELSVHGGGERPLFLELIRQEAARRPD